MAWFSWRTKQAAGPSVTVIAHHCGRRSGFSCCRIKDTFPDLCGGNEGSLVALDSFKAELRANGQMHLWNLHHSSKDLYFCPASPDIYTALPGRSNRWVTWLVPEQYNSVTSLSLAWTVWLDSEEAAARWGHSSAHSVHTCELQHSWLAPANLPPFLLSCNFIFNHLPTA